MIRPSLARGLYLVFVAIGAQAATIPVPTVTAATVSLSVFGDTDHGPGYCLLGTGPTCEEAHMSTSFAVTELGLAYYTGDAEISGGTKTTLTATANSVFNTVVNTSAELDFWLEFAGPATVELPVDIDALLVTSESFSSPYSGAGGKADFQIDGTPMFKSVSCTVSDCTSPSFNGTIKGNLLSNTMYEAEMFVSAAANHGNIATAVVDPHIYIDPSFAQAGAYSLILSDGVGNAGPGSTPEPSTILTGGGALLALGLGRRRKSRAGERTAGRA